MKILRLSARGRLAGVFCFCLYTLNLAGLAAFADEWQADIQFASCECGAAESGCCASECTDGCCTPAACDCGYCFSCPMSDELMRRMTVMAKSMEAQGIVYAPGVTQFYQGVASGGQEREFEYGGKVDQFLILDSCKLGLWDGMTMTMHAETRFGDDVNFEAVGFAPVNVAMLYPKEDEHETAITGLTFAQTLHDDVQFTFGKFNGLDLWYSLYPETGRGVNGFMNASMVLPLSIARTVPLSFMGAGVLKYHGKLPEGGVLVFDTQNVATTSGFDDMFDNGANILGFWRFFTDLNGLPGSHMFGGIWSTGEFVSFDPTGFVFVPGQGLVVDRVGGAFTLLYVLEQTLWMDCCNKDRNVVLLSQWGLADPETSPVSWSANVGIQANGFSDSRPHDSMGVGYFHTGVSNDVENALSPLIPLQDVDGVELYYNMAVAKGFQVTSDLQVIEPADERNDTTIVFGLRGTVGL
jgi:porin